jgi:hypothetical protein
LTKVACNQSFNQDDLNIAIPAKLLSETILVRDNYEEADEYNQMMSAI